MSILKRLFVTLLVTAGFVYMGYILLNQQVKLNELKDEIAYYNKELQSEQLETEQLNDTLASLSQDDYIEEVARERLGLVMPTEIIFMDASI